jgi:hypothetical protein
VTIGANNYTATIDVSPIDDSAYEPDETVIATLTSSANYSISAAQPATVIIQSIFELKGTGGTYASEVYAVNDNGQAVGDLGRHNADGSFGESYSFVPYGINNAGNVVGPGYAKIGGTTHNLGSFNGLSINNNNSVCGWDSGYVYYLTYSGGSFSSPNLIGDGWSGDIDVWYDVNNPYDVITGASLPNSYYYHPYYGWPGTLPSATGSSLAYPMGINSSGDVVGVEEVAWEDPQPGEPAVIDVGVLWSSGGYYSTPTLLTSFPAGVSNYCGSFPYKINSSGVIVGRIQDVTWRAGIWLSGQWYYLDDVIGDANWTFGNAYDISNNGHIVGTGAHNNQGRCFVIRP